MLLAAFVLVGMRREAEAQNVCANNLRQIGLGLHNYASVHADDFPYGTIQNDGLDPQNRLGWLVSLWIFIDQWFWIFDTSKPWNDDTNRITRGRGVVGDIEVVGRIQVLCCPAVKQPAGEPMPGLTSYVGVTGFGRDSGSLPKGDPRIGVFGYYRQTVLAEIKDGLATTIAVAETAERGPWTAGGTHTLRGLDPERKPYLGRTGQFGGNHGDGAMVLFADGSVRLLRDSIDPKVFEALSTIAGGERLPDGWGG
jgi:prepilin-type processing-associated H-X9-DG protein